MAGDDQSNDTPAVLFVCTGNTCRSVLAEALARRRFGSAVRVSSAGIRPQKPKDAQDAIDTLRRVFNIEISGHIPRDVWSVNLDMFDHVVSLDAEVTRLLKTKRPRDLIKCHIDDPWGDPQKYEACALKIMRSLTQLKSLLKHRAV